MTAAPGATQLEVVFARIHRERMADLPIVNPALRVEAIGFRPWQTGQVGVLITPWCMNLIHLPGADGVAAVPPTGGKRHLRFPSGIYEFIAAEETQLGRYEMCSLFSPMFQFPDHATAVAIADEALTALMTAEPAGDDAAAAARGKGHDAGISRRDLLRGVFRRGPESP